MFSGIHDVDWASMHHAYGSAAEVPALLEGLRSPDAERREQALGDFYGKVHHQGDVYPSTAAGLPFLLELAVDPDTPDRHEIVALMVSIGEHAIERDFDGCAAAVAFLRAHVDVFADLTADAVCRVRRAAVPALGLLLDDADRALSLLRERSTMEYCLRERLVVAETTATLARRRPVIAPAAAGWLGGLTGEPEFRLAVVIQQARCHPDEVGDDLVPAVIGLLREIADAAPPEQPWPEPPLITPPAEGVPPFVAAAFEDLERANLRYALTTDLLHALHELLGARVRPRTELLAEQLRSPDPGTRLDAIRMAGDLVGSFRGDHSALIRQVAAQLGAGNLEVAAEAATLLEGCHPLGEPARDALGELVAGHGPDGWTSPRRHLRRTHQRAVLALARLGDERALPSLLLALDTGVDDWLAIPAVRSFPQAADQLLPRLRACASAKRPGALAGLAEFDAPAAVPLLIEALTTDDADTVKSALATLRELGPAAAPALPAIRSAATPPTGEASVDETWIWSAAVATLWAVGGDHEEVLPLALALLDTFAKREASDVLGRIGPSAAAALPRLRQLLNDDYDWNRVHAAAAIWDIAGEPDALDVLLPPWRKNAFTRSYVVACLKRMGAAAAPAEPQIRAELANPERRQWFGTTADDEKLLRDLAEALRAVTAGSA
ncbi:hypothetical protein [Actinoplanes sp. HUAS TT8]|uniref:hypothetical protein n=1 Tax=Actinoplanes sp. HUAS TT8 TaxID=3447453 RepID=UPI003F522F0D